MTWGWCVSVVRQYPERSSHAHCAATWLAGAATCALSLKSDLGMSWEDAASALQQAADLALERGEEASPHK
jgi:hypothetical protein